MWKVLIYLIIYISFTVADIQYITPLYLGKSSIFISQSFQPIHITQLIRAKNGIIYGQYYDTNNRVYSSSIGMLTIDTNIQIRAPTFLLSSKNATYLTFTSYKVYLINHTDLSIKTIYTAKIGQIIMDVCFGLSLSDIYILKNQTNLMKLQLLSIINNVQINCINLTLTNSSSKFDQMILGHSMIYISFQTQLLSYSSNSSLILKFTKSYTNTNIKYIDMYFKQDIFVMITNNNLFVFNQSSGLNKSKNFPLNFTSLTLTQTTILVLMTDTMLYQYDFIDDIFLQNISRVQKSTQANTIRYYNINKLACFSSYANTSTQYYYGITLAYTPTIAQNCSFTYLFNNSTKQCQKNTTLPMSSGQDIPFKNNTGIYEINVTQNQIINTNEQKKNYLENVNNNTIREVVEVAGKAMAFASLRIMPKCIFIFMVFLDDLQYYQYHHKSGPEYPSTVQFFYEKIDLVNELRIHPFFLEKINHLMNSNVSQQTNQIYVNYLNFTNSDPDKVYFISSTQEIYKTNLISNLTIFLIVKIVQLFLYFLRNKAALLASCYRQYRAQAKWWTLIVAIIQVNAAKFAFDVSLQFLLPSFFGFVDKLSFFFTVSMFFIVIIYALCFYKMVFRFSTRRQAMTLLIRCKFGMKSFIFQPIFIITRSILRSFIHGFLLENYKLQILFLTITDILYIFVGIGMRKHFRSKILFLLCLFYQISFTIFDFYFLLQINFEIPNSFDRQLFGLVVVGIIGIYSVLICLTILSITTYQLYKNFRKVLNFHQLFTHQTQPNSIVINRNLDRQFSQLQNKAQKKGIINLKSLRKLHNIMNKKTQKNTKMLVIKQKKLQNIGNEIQDYQTYNLKHKSKALKTAKFSKQVNNQFNPQLYNSYNKSINNLKDKMVKLIVKRNKQV